MTPHPYPSPLNTTEDLMQLLETWVERKWLREIDLALTRFFWSEVPDAEPLLLFASALTSHQLGRGHICLDLQYTLDNPYLSLSLPPEGNNGPALANTPLPSDILSGITPQYWYSKLQHPSLVSRGAGNTPLVFSGWHLYLRRYWQYERNVEIAIRHRLAQTKNIEIGLPQEYCKEMLSRLFPATATNASANTTDWQKIACALAARSAFSIITGGPGTGKTTTVVKLLILLQSLAIKGGSDTRPLRIRLAAPTGKAAARLRESISGTLERLPSSVLKLDGLREAIPTKVTTLHRLLGSRPNHRQYRHDARNPLALDILVVDEASMVDLEMMAAVLSALPDHARLILLGDKDQLASVEAGSMLGELCRRAKDGNFTQETMAWLLNITGENIEEALLNPAGTQLDQNTVMLRYSHRFTAGSGIGQLAEAVNNGDALQIERIWNRRYPDLKKHDLETIQDPALDSLIIGTTDSTTALTRQKGYAHYLLLMANQHPSIHADISEFDNWARTVIAAYDQFQVLCALRNGPHGVTGLNQRISEALSRHRLIDVSTPWYQGRPVLVTRNDYRLGLMNGDIGITLRYPQRDKRSGETHWVTRVAFPKNDGINGIHWILPSRLLSVETVYALTVHKSQGSEFEHCVLLLPPQLNPALTRELVYTGITRARKWFSLISVGNPRIMSEASTRTVQRSGGLSL